MPTRLFTLKNYSLLSGLSGGGSILKYLKRFLELEIFSNLWLRRFRCRRRRRLRSCILLLLLVDEVIYLKRLRRIRTLDLDRRLQSGARSLFTKERAAVRRCPFSDRQQVTAAT